MRVTQLPNNVVLSAANKFFDAAILLKQSSTLAAPKIVNGAFALELYLKSLNTDLVFSGGKEIESGVIAYQEVNNVPNQKGHNPSKLFNAIPPEIKSDLENKYSVICKNQTLLNALEAFDGVFEKWRYIFEAHTKAVCLTDLMFLLSFINSYANNLHKNRA